MSDDGEGFFHSEGRFHLPHHHHDGHVDLPAHQPTIVSGEIVKIFCEARPDYNLAVRHHEVVLVPGDDNDPHQSWIKDESWSTKVKDSAGFPAFALVNRGTGKALRHAEGPETSVLLDEYELNVLNEVILWTAGGDVGDGYRAIRPVNDIHLNLDADHGAEKYGGVKDGNKVILFKWKNDLNQRWKWEPLEHHRVYPSRLHEQYGDHHSRSHNRYDHDYDRHSRSHERGHEHHPDHRQHHDGEYGRHGDYQNVFRYEH